MKGLTIIKQTLFVIALLIIGVIYLWDLPNQSMHEDEHVWIQRGAFFFETFFVEGDFSNPVWQSYYSYDQPKLGEYLYGGFTRLVYRENAQSLFERTDFNQGEKGLADSRTPDKWWLAYQAQSPQQQFIPNKWQLAYQIITFNRYLAVAFGIGALIFIFLIGRIIGGFWLGFLAMILLAQHRLFFRLSRQATADSILIFLILGGLYWSLVLAEKKRKKMQEQIPSLLGLGIWFGLTASLKLNGLMALALGVATISAKEMRQTLTRKGNYLKAVWQALAKMVVVSLLTVGIFVFLNPFLWSNPIEKFLFMLASRQEVAQGMQNSYPQSAYYSFTERLKTIAEETILSGKLNQRTLPWIPGQIDLFLVIMGGLFILFNLIIKKSNFVLAIFVLWALGVLFFMGNYLTVGFDRYFLPIIPFLVVVEVFGIYKLMAIVLTTGKLITE